MRYCYPQACVWPLSYARVTKHGAVPRNSTSHTVHWVLPHIAQGHHMLLLRHRKSMKNNHTIPFVRAHPCMCVGAGGGEGGGKQLPPPKPVTSLQCNIPCCNPQYPEPNCNLPNQQPVMTAPLHLHHRTPMTWTLHTPLHNIPIMVKLVSVLFCCNAVHTEAQPSLPMEFPADHTCSETQTAKPQPAAASWDHCITLQQPQHALHSTNTYTTTTDECCQLPPAVCEP